jgi:hypothetical protein
VSQNHEIYSDDVRNESEFRLVLQLVEGKPAGEHGHMRAFGKELKDSGVLVSAEGLDFPGDPPQMKMLACVCMLQLGQSHS